MRQRFYFTNEDGDNIMNDHIGTVKGAITKAQKYADNHGCDVYVNSCCPDEIVEVVFA